MFIIVYNYIYLSIKCKVYFNCFSYYYLDKRVKGFKDLKNLTQDSFYASKSGNPVKYFLQFLTSHSHNFQV